MEKQSFLNIAKERRNLVVTLAISIFAINGLVFFTAGSEMELVVSDLSRIGTVGSAVAVSLVVIAKQKTGGLFGRTYAALAIGLALWLAAESAWGYYEVVQQIERPFPSIADALWIIGYGPFIYHLVGTSRFFGKGVKKSTVGIVIIAGALFAYFSASIIVGTFEVITIEDSFLLGINLAYPMLDTVCLIPAVIVLANAGRGQLTSIPWIFMAFILFIIGDTMLGVSLMIESSEVYPITMLYNAGYLCITAGLLWYNRMFLMGEKLAKR